MDIREEVYNLGVQQTELPSYWDKEQQTTRYHRVDDVDLAHAMALAMDPIMERLIEQRDFLAPLVESPDATYRRAGSKAVWFATLAEEQMDIEDESRKNELGYVPEPDLDSYVDRKVGEYIQDQTGTAGYYRYFPKSELRITNGFVATLVESAAKRTERAADKAGKIVYTAQKTRENIAVFEQVLTKRDQEVFQRLEPRKRDNILASWSEENEELIALDERETELWDIYNNRKVVEAIAGTFGRKSLRGFTRQDYLALSEVIKEEHYSITQ